MCFDNKIHKENSKWFYETHADCVISGSAPPMRNVLTGKKHYAKNPIKLRKKETIHERFMRPC